MPSVQNQSTSRLQGLDAARAVAVLAMVMGHCLDAVLSEPARNTPGMLVYWQFRTFTAPLFLLVSGWAVMTSVSRLDLSGWAVLRRYLPRVGLLMALGFLLRLPLWDLHGFVHFDRNVWQHFLAFDALHAIASSLLVGIVVVAITPRGWVRMLALVALAVGIPMASQAVWNVGAQPHGSLLIREVLGGGLSPFTFFPWAGFFFTGALVGLAVNTLSRPRDRALLLVGAAVLAMALTGRTPVEAMPPASMMLFSWRLGVPFLILAGCLVLPAWLTTRLAPIGRASLWVYVIHLPIAYGWAYWPGLDSRVGHSLDVGWALSVAASVVLFSVTLALVSRHVKHRIRPRKSISFVDPSVKDIEPVRPAVS